MQVLNLIVALDKNRCIGKSGPIPLVWKQKEDMKRFKQRTTGGVVIMGYNTFMSMGKPLPKRANIVVSANHSDELRKRADLLVATSLEEAIKMGKIIGLEMFLIGGGMLYNEAIKKDLVKQYCITIVETELPADAENSFVNLPTITKEWEKEILGDAGPDEENKFYSVFVDIRRK